MDLSQLTGHIWLDGEMVPWQEAKVHVLTHTFHYGLGVFDLKLVLRIDRYARCGAVLERCYERRAEAVVETPWIAPAQYQGVRRSRH